MRLFLGIIFVCLFLYLDGADVREILNRIPEEDRADISFAFSVLVKENQFPYTLFGDKPVSHYGYYVHPPLENVLERVTSGVHFQNGWRTWGKYRHLFPMKNYILTDEPLKHSEFETRTVVLINKPEFVKTVRSNLALFESVLGRKVDPVGMLDDIESGSGRSTFADAIGDNDMLLGILLGYGRHNAILYNRRERETFNSHLLSTPYLEYSQIKLQGCGDYAFSPLYIGAVYFSADLDHPETIALRNKYRELRGKISAIYTQGDILEITLSQLMD